MALCTGARSEALKNDLCSCVCVRVLHSCALIIAACMQFVKRADLKKGARVVEVSRAGHAYAAEKRREAEAVQQRQLESMQRSREKFAGLWCLQTPADVEVLAAGPSNFSAQKAAGGRWKEAYDNLKWHHDRYFEENAEALTFNSTHTKLFNATRATMDPEKCSLDAEALSEADRAKLSAKLESKVTPSAMYCKNTGTCCKKALLKLMTTQKDMPPMHNGVPPSAPERNGSPTDAPVAAAPVAAQARAPAAVPRRARAPGVSLAVSDDSSNFSRPEPRTSNQSVGSVPTRRPARAQHAQPARRTRPKRAAAQQFLDNMAAGSPTLSALTSPHEQARKAAPSPSAHLGSQMGSQRSAPLYQSQSMLASQVTEE